MHGFIDRARTDLLMSIVLRKSTELLENVLALVGWPAESKLVKSVQEDVLGENALSAALHSREEIFDRASLDKASLL